MRTLAILILLAQSLYGTPVYEFFRKGSADYYRVNSESIVDFFHTKLSWPTNDYSILFRQCREQFTSFGFELGASVKVNIFEINLNLDGPLIQDVSFYCKNSKAVSAQLVKINKLKLKHEAYYYFRWNVLKSKLDIYAIHRGLPKDVLKTGRKEFDKLIPIYLSNVQNQQIILFGELVDQQKKIEIHPLMDLSYPLRFDPIGNEFEFSVIEISPIFFSVKTREIFKKFGKAFGIIPDRVMIRNKVPVAVMP